MTTISLSDWSQSPEIVIGKEEHRRLTIVALTDIGENGDHMDYLLYELDRARIVNDAMLPSDVVRIGSMVRYKPVSGQERVIKLVMPQDVDASGTYRLSVTSAHGAALIGLRQGSIMCWLDPSGTVQRLEVLKVANRAPGNDPGPAAA